MFFTVVFCCCLCDCRVPKTGYDKGDAENADDDGSDTEPSVFHSKPLQAGKLVNGSSQQIGDKKKRPDSENEDGKVNEAFVGEKETPAQGKGWKTVQKTMLSRQPWLLRDLKQKYKVTLQQHEEKYLRGNDAILVFFRFKRALTRPFCVWSSIHAGKKSISTKRVYQVLPNYYPRESNSSFWRVSRYPFFDQKISGRSHVSDLSLLSFTSNIWFIYLLTTSYNYSKK